MRDGKMLEFETRGRYSNGESSLDIRIGNIFYGTEGYLEINGGTWKAFRKREKEPFAGSANLNEKQVDATSTRLLAKCTDHWANFIDAIRSGNDEDSELRYSLKVIYSSALPQLANISYRAGT